jgi:hypothetical protein
MHTNAEEKYVPHSSQPHRDEWVYRSSIRAAALLALLLPLSALAVAPPKPVLNPNSPAPRAAASGQSGFGRLDPSEPTGITPDQIIAKFGKRESDFAKARDEYTFRQTVVVNTVDEDTNRPNGEYRQVTDIVFDKDDKRTEHVIFAPQNSLVNVMMTENDFDDIEHRLPFVLTSPELPEYDLTYLGRQKVDDIDTYVFDCKPKVIEKKKRYFQGKVWVDQQEFEIVLINGKSVPDILRRGNEDLSPPYTTYYQEVDGGYWFPVYTKADGVLHFPAGEGYAANNVHLRYVVKYEDYKRFHAKSRIIYNGETLAPESTTTNKPAAPPPASENGLPPPTDPNSLPPPDPNAPPLVRPKTTPPPPVYF